MKYADRLVYQFLRLFGHGRLARTSFAANQPPVHLSVQLPQFRADTNRLASQNTPARDLSSLLYVVDISAAEGRTLDDWPVMESLTGRNPAKKRYSG